VGVAADAGPVSDDGVALDGAVDGGGIVDAASLDGSPSDTAVDQAFAPDMPSDVPRSPDAGQPDAAPEVDAAEPDAFVEPVCGNGELERGEACDGAPACVDCAWASCDALSICQAGRLLPPQHARFQAARRSGAFIVVGEPSFEVRGERSAGRVRIYEDTADGYALRQTLTAPSPARDGLFGVALSFEGERLAVGESGAGRVHIYGLEEMAWVRRQGLSASGGFGAAVDWSGGALAVGRPTEGRTGAVTVYVDVDGRLEEHATLAPETLVRGDQFGRALAFDGAWLVVGAIEAEEVYVFRAEDEGVEGVARIASEGPEGLLFGRRLALHDGVALVGTDRADDGRGAVTVLSVEDGEWAIRQRLQPPQVRAGERFGSALAIHGDRALVAANQSGLPRRDSKGRVLVFERGEDAWSMVGELAWGERGSLGTTLDLDEATITVGVSGLWARIGNLATWTSAVYEYR